MPPNDLHGGLPTFSVIVPTYNRPAPLAECLAALAAMDYPSDRFEVIVVDDGGTSDLTPLIDRFRNALKLKCLKQSNAGPSATRNAGAAAADNDFLAFTDDDCRPHQNWLRRLAPAVAANRDALVGGRCHNPLPDNLYAVASQMILDVVDAHFNHDCNRCTFFPSNNIAMLRQNFMEIGGFNPCFRWSEDRELCSRWSARGWRLILAPDAIVEHAREMGLYGFCKQHFGYGRGAWRFHRIRKLQGTGKLRIEGSFYLECFRHPLKTQPISRAIPLVALLGIWQVANAAGFAYEGINHFIRLWRHHR